MKRGIGESSTETVRNPQGLPGDPLLREEVAAVLLRAFFHGLRGRAKRLSPNPHAESRERLRHRAIAERAAPWGKQALWKKKKAEFRGRGGDTEFGAEVVEERSVAQRVHHVASHSPAAVVVYSG